MFSVKNAITALALIASPNVLADALITKTNNSGFTFEPTTKVCKVYDFFVEVKETQYTREGVKENTQYYFHLDGFKVRRTLRNVQNERLIASPNYLCDGPSTSIRVAGQSEDGVTLFNTGGCGSDRLERRGPKTKILTQVVDRFCPVTHDFGGPTDEVEFNFDFNAGADDWKVGFADYPVGQEDFYELNSEWTTLPAPLRGNGLLVEGNNHSDDLFMFVKRQVQGLQANTEYEVELNLEIASNSPKGCFGVGGAPGESVYVKGGVSDIEPKAIVEGNDYRMNIDKANQSQSGRNAVVMGNMAVGDCEGVQPYERKSFTSERVAVVSDENGSAWIMFGTDSGFEATTSMYYTKASARFMKRF